jgi:hypothetical protein
MHATGISAEEKRAALQQVLGSVTFRRAEQLRQFLEFVVEEDIAGRGARIREWDIAVRALNRPDTYTPETDSTVRTRAHSLRQRLTEYYRMEAPDAEVRIDLPKGGYTPRFSRLSETPVPDSEPAESPEPEVFSASATRPWWIWVVAGLVLGAAVAYALMRPSRPPSELREAWGPVFDSKSPVKIVMSSPYQFWVRDYRNHPPPVIDPVETPPMPGDPGLLRAYSEQFPLHPDSHLYLHGNSAGALWGDAAGVQVATRFLTENGVRTEFVPEKSLKSGYVFRNDSYLSFGRSEYSPLMSGKIPAEGFDVMYIPSIRRHAIARRSDPEKGPKFLPTPGTPAVNYGLITIIRDNAGDGHACQAMFFAGVISNGAQAGIEYLTTPHHMRQLIGKLRAAGLNTWPKVMQIVVRSDTTEFYPIRTEYETHLILQK